MNRSESRHVYSGSMKKQAGQNIISKLKLIATSPVPQFNV
jgi:hypothetical protein